MHSWKLTVKEAMALQIQLASEVIQKDTVDDIRFIAGIDVSTQRLSSEGTAAVVVMEYPQLRIVEEKTVHGKIEFPYVPGLLSYRELPLVLQTCAQLTTTPDLFMIDGQGLAHPRRFGIASHLGLLFDKPTIGCAKSRLCGTHRDMGIEAGSYSELLDDDEVIGVALRTRYGTNPVYVSVGHKISLHKAIRWVLACCKGLRLPEPTRLAHQAAGGNLKPVTPVSLGSGVF
jgi:deoxyribonuclease V